MRQKYFGLLSILLLVGCGSSTLQKSLTPTTPISDFNPPTPSCQGPASGSQATICGTLLAPDGQTPITEASIQLVENSGAGKSVTVLENAKDDSLGCRSTATGFFSCSLNITTEGLKYFQVDGKGFSYSFQAYLKPGLPYFIPLTNTTAWTGQNGRKFAVITGRYDKVENVLQRILNCGVTDLSGNLLYGTECPQLQLVDGASKLLLKTNPNELLTEKLNLPKGTYPTAESFLKNKTALQLFDAIFLNCGMTESFETDPVVKQNLIDYVAGGGNLYVSDYAYDYIEQTFPDKIDWHQGVNGLSNIAETPNLAKKGASNPAQKVSVPDAGLLEWLRSQNLATTSLNEILINFNLGSWVMMDGAAGGVSSILTAPFPIAVDFAHGRGCVFYVSYHTEAAADASIEKTDPQERIIDYLIINRIGSCYETTPPGTL